VSAVPEIYDDEELLAVLRQALAERQAVPPEFVEAAKNAFAWHNIDIDVELAELTYDSSRDAETAPSTRAETASIRALTFTSAHLTIELEVTRDSLLGQIVPAQPGTIKVQLRDGAETTVPADEIGRFTIRPMPTGTFRLHCRTSADADALTGWITL
jgi:hypothetical protein